MATALVRELAACTRSGPERGSRDCVARRTARAPGPTCNKEAPPNVKMGGGECKPRLEAILCKLASSGKRKAGRAIRNECSRGGSTIRGAGGIVTGVDTSVTWRRHVPHCGHRRLFRNNVHNTTSTYRPSVAERRWTPAKKFQAARIHRRARLKSSRGWRHFCCAPLQNSKRRWATPHGYTYPGVKGGNSPRDQTI